VLVALAAPLSPQSSVVAETPAPRIALKDFVFQAMTDDQLNTACAQTNQVNFTGKLCVWFAIFIKGFAGLFCRMD